MSRFTTIKAELMAEAGVLAPTLTEALPMAVGRTRATLRGYPLEEFPHLASLTLRCDLRMVIAEEFPLPPGWRLGGDPRKMGQLLLSHDRLGVDLRFLKGNKSVYVDGVPNAGSNRARMEAWSDKDEALPLPALLNLGIPDTQRLTVLWLWDLTKGRITDLDVGIQQRLVHTIAPGTFGSGVPCDFYLDLRADGEIHNRLAFAGGEHETDLFHIEAEEETAGDGD